MSWLNWAGEVLSIYKPNFLEFKELEVNFQYVLSQSWRNIDWDVSAVFSPCRHLFNCFLLY